VQFAIATTLECSFGETHGFCENEQLRSFVPGIGKRGDRLIAALFEAGRIAAVSADVVAAP
jgi:hypothetical protein